jgi:hypothetical protein
MQALQEYIEMLRAAIEATGDRKRAAMLTEKLAEAEAVAREAK